MWDTTEKGQIRKILRFLAWATRLERTLQEKWCEDNEFYASITIGLLHTTMHSSHGIPSHLWPDMSFSSLSLATMLLTFCIRVRKKIQSSKTKIFHIRVACYLHAVNVISSLCVLEILPLISNLEHIIYNIFPEIHPCSVMPPSSGQPPYWALLHQWDTL